MSNLLDPYEKQAVCTCGFQRILVKDTVKDPNFKARAIKNIFIGFHLNHS